jgi:hypothetical protein
MERTKEMRREDEKRRSERNYLSLNSCGILHS